MVIGSIIIGILFIIGGFVCICAPVDTFFSLIYFLAIVLFVYGIWGVIRFFQKRTSGLGLVVSILAIIVGFIYLFRPGNTPPPGDLAALDKVVLFIIALWFVIKGIVGIQISVSTRLVNRRWVLGLIVGVLSIILGIYSFAYPAVGAMTVGTLTGLYLIECGLDLLVFGTRAGMIKSAVKKVDNAVNEAVEEAREAVSKLADDIKADAAAAEETVAEAAEEVKEDVQAAAEAAGEAAEETVAEAAEEVKADVEAAAEAAEDAVDSAAGADDKSE